MDESLTLLAVYAAHRAHARRSAEAVEDDALLAKALTGLHPTQLASFTAWATKKGIVLPPTTPPPSAPAEVVVVAKAVHIEKAWAGSDGSAIIEGWISTEDEDAEKDIVPPESFQYAMPGYLSRRAPLSSEHNMKGYPIGHMQRIALVRGGAIFAEGTHPSDDAAFEHFPATGTGVYGRGVITDENAATAVRKGNVGGFSWVGRLREFDRTPNGGRRFGRIDPWMESTVAAYPVNSNALLVAAKAYATALAQGGHE